MNTTFIAICAVLLYLAAGTGLALRLSRGTAAAKPKSRLIMLGMAAVTLHGVVLYQTVVATQGLNLAFSNATSILAWMIALMVLITSMTKPVENLGIAVLPLAGLALVAELLFPSARIISDSALPGLRIHIMVSIISYSLMSIAAVQAILLSIQDKHLHNKRPGGFIRALPPMETMETLLFQMIGLGFVLQSLSLLSGVIVIEDMFAQHMVHKTVLSILAWLVFGTLLLGRWRFGWRGRTAPPSWLPAPRLQAGRGRCPDHRGAAPPGAVPARGGSTALHGSARGSRQRRLGATAVIRLVEVSVGGRDEHPMLSVPSTAATRVI